MTATYRLKGVGWLAVCVIVALGFYLVSLQVAVERSKLDSVDRSITQAHRDIRALETEFSTRSNLAQLERWNGEVLALTAPMPDQYVHSEAQLASLNFAAPGDPKVEMAALVIPTLPTMTPPPVATPVPAADAVPVVPSTQVRVAAATPVVIHVVQAKAVAPAVAPLRIAALDRPKAQAMAMLDRKLLSDHTLGDLMSGARAETASLR